MAPFADGRFGFLLSGSFSRRNFGSDDIEPEYDLGDPGLDDDALEGLDQRYYTLWRERIGATGNFDYRLGEYSNLSLTGIYSELQDDEQRQRVSNAIEDGELVFLHKNRFEREKTCNLSLGGDHLTRGGVGLDYHLTFARSSEDEHYDNEIEFIQEGVDFSPGHQRPGQHSDQSDGRGDGRYLPVQ